MLTLAHCSWHPSLMKKLSIMAVLAISTLVLGCSDDTEETDDSSEGQAGAPGDGEVEDKIGCLAACENVDSCAPESYTAVGGDYDDKVSCIEFCIEQNDDFATKGCGAEHAAIQACMATPVCTDVVAFLTDPTTAGVCVDELSAIAACLN